MAEIAPRRANSLVHERPSQITLNTYKKRKDTRDRTLYLLDYTLASLKNSKLPKHHDVLARFVAVHQEFWCKKTAADIVASEVISVWQYHFGLKLTHGKDTIEQKNVDEKVRFIHKKDVIVGKIMKLQREWSELKASSERTDRKNTVTFKEKVNKFKEHLDMPMNICKD